MKILVTGGAGYIGSHTIKKLGRQGHELLTIDNLSTGHRGAVLFGDFKKGDIRDPVFLRRVFSSFRPQALVHFAASVIVPESVENPLLYWDNNISAMITLLRAAVEHQVKMAVFSSSAAVYGEPEKIPVTEDHPRRPANPYGMTKLVGEGILADCDLAHGLKSVCLRYFNASGVDPEGELVEDREVETHLIPLVLKAAIAAREKKHRAKGRGHSGGKELLIFGNDYPTPDGTCVRDYIHVNDLAQAHILALEWLSREKRSGVFNVGNGRGYSVRQVIEVSRRVTGLPIPSRDVPRRPGDPAELVASSEKIRKVLGWKPEIPELEKIISSSWNYFSKQVAGSRKQVAGNQ
ncbi:MAG: UDP-glucose 4-epimerase GalE [bacterium]|nr:UDP-glucose 4-epimerase GalE [bacterium]